MANYSEENLKAFLEVERKRKEKGFYEKKKGRPKSPTSRRSTKGKSAWQEMTDWVEEIRQSVGADLNEGLNEAADFLIEKFIENTPVSDDDDRAGTTKKSWVVVKKYNNVKYIYNTAENKKRIPIVNLLEHAKNGKPFVRKTFQANKDAAMNIVKARIEKGGSE